MDYSIAIIFGIVQGIAEFIPVSSSGHLLLLHSLFPDFQDIQDIAFDVSLHFGTLLALVIFYWKDLRQYLLAWLSPRASHTRSKRMESLYVLLAAIPAAIAALLFGNTIETVLRSPWVVVVMLVVVAFVFFGVERWYRPERAHDQSELTIRDALLIGCMQIIALVPGTSRSGITISTGMLTGLTRSAAARFSFLVAIPITGGACLKKGMDLVQMSLTGEQWIVLVIGVVASFLTGMIALRFLSSFFARRSLRAFGWYRIGLAVCAAFALIFF